MRAAQAAVEPSIAMSLLDIRPGTPGDSTLRIGIEPGVGTVVYLSGARYLMESGAAHWYSDGLWHDLSLEYSLYEPSGKPWLGLTVDGATLGRVYFDSASILNLPTDTGIYFGYSRIDSYVDGENFELDDLNIREDIQ